MIAQLVVARQRGLLLYFTLQSTYMYELSIY